MIKNVLEEFSDFCQFCQLLFRILHEKLFVVSFGFNINEYLPADARNTIFVREAVRSLLKDTREVKGILEYRRKNKTTVIDVYRELFCSLMFNDINQSMRANIAFRNKMERKLILMAPKLSSNK